MKGIMLMILCVLTLSAYAQADWHWYNRITSTGNVIASNLIKDNSGNLYIAGRIDSTAYFGDITLTVTTGSKGFLAKMNPSGQWLWVKEIGSTDYAGVGRICYDPTGYIYLQGTCRTNLQVEGLDTFTPLYPYRTTFVLKCDLQGEWIWGRLADNNSPSWTIPRGITSDSDGNCYLTGNFSTQIHFGDITINAGISSYIARLTSAGEWDWAVSFPYPVCDFSDIASDGQGNMYIVGILMGDVEFGSYHVSANPQNPDLLIAKADSVCNWQWAYQSYTGGDAAIGISIDAQNSIFVIGASVRGYDTPLQTYGNQTRLPGNIYVAHFNQNGTCLQSISDQDLSISYPTCVAADNSGGCYIGVSCYGLETFGNYDLIGGQGICRSTPNLDWQWVIGYMCSPGSGETIGIVPIQNGNCAIAISHHYNFTLGEWLIDNTGLTNVVIAECGTSTSNEDNTDISATMLQAYPNPFRTDLNITLQSKENYSKDISIYNIKGQLIRQWKDSKTTELLWDGKDASGLSVRSGLYLIKSLQGKQTSTVKVIKL